MARQHFTASFTQRAPIPEEAIAAVGGKPNLVAIIDGQVIDRDDPAAKARYVLLSNMRGHLCGRRPHVVPQSLPRTQAVLAGLFDMCLPPTLTHAECDLIATHIGDAGLALRLEGAA